ncbi:sensor histidine kinase [Microbulbifer sp. CnH-101-G]|uniref:sensor histidine kinase n=1 Tax=Microbulbifer sp. CnH-101-G TaxID=3243393 RepID=UPI00403944E8
MSFTKKIKLLKSSNFKLATITFSLVCLSSTISLIATYFLTKKSLVEPALSLIEETAKESITEIDELGFFHPRIYPKFQEIKPKNFINNEASPSKFTKSYIEFFTNLISQENLDQQEKLAAQGRLFALGEDINPPLKYIPSILIWHLLNSEFPEDFHDYIDNITDERFNDWPKYHKKIQSDQTLLAKHYIEAEYFLDTEELCVQILDSNHNSILSNIERPTPGNLKYKSAYTVISNSDFTFDQEKNQKVCLVKAYPLSDGGSLLLGREFTREYELLELLKTIIFIGFLITVLISLLCGYLVSRHAVKRISEINQVCRQIMIGDLSKRVPVNNTGSDCDQLALHINSMLDKIQQLMSGVKQVSDNIAHDLKSPLTRLRGQLELLLSMEKLERGTIEAIIDENDRIIDCFNALLRISQIEQGARRSAFKSFSLHHVIDTLVDVYEPTFQDLGIQLCLNLNNEQHFIYGDKEQWSQAIANLLDNVIKYAPHSGNLDISLTTSFHKDGNYLHLELHDRGPGIPEDDLQKVFERFYRLESHRHTRGNGLGLSLVMAVCNLHNAKIKLNNCKGLLVQIDIPIRKKSHFQDSSSSKNIETAQL